MAIKCIFPNAANHAPLIAWLRDAAGGETERSVEFANIEGGAQPGNGYWDNNENKIKVGAPPVAPVAPSAAEIGRYTVAALDRANVTWIVTGTTIAENARWVDFHYWIGSAHLVCTAVAASAAHDATVKRRVFDAYKALVPLDYEKLAIWYRNHSQAIWTAYRTAVGQNNFSGAHFGFDLTTEELPSFASDAASARAWNGTGDTLAVTVPLNWRAP